MTVTENRSEIADASDGGRTLLRIPARFQPFSQPQEVY